MLNKVMDEEIQDILMTHSGDTYVLFADGVWSQARLNPTDTYRPDVGVAVAIAHDLGYDIPDYIWEKGNANTCLRYSFLDLRGLKIILDLLCDVW